MHCPVGATRRNKGPRPTPHSRPQAPNTRATPQAVPGVVFLFSWSAWCGTRWCSINACEANARETSGTLERAAFHQHAVSLFLPKQHFICKVQLHSQGQIWGHPLKRGEQGSRGQIMKPYCAVQTLTHCPLRKMSLCLSFLICKMRIIIILNS